MVSENMLIHPAVFLLVIFFLMSIEPSVGQKQLLLLKREKVLLRLNAGDDFNYKLKDSAGVNFSYLNNLSDTAVLAHQTVVPLHTVDRLYFDRETLANRLGKWLIIGGAGYFLIDQFNTVIVRGEEASLDESVTTTAGIMIGVGIPLMVIKKKSQRVGGRYRLLVVDEHSPFYVPTRRDGIQ